MNQLTFKTRIQIHQGGGVFTQSGPFQLPTVPSKGDRFRYVNNSTGTEIEIDVTEVQHRYSVDETDESYDVTIKGDPVG